jgi:hypothetical protein
MGFKTIMSGNKGSVLVGAIVILVAVTVIGITLIIVSNSEVNMAANEKCKEEARYNSESCTVAGIKLVKMTSQVATKEGILGIPEGNNGPIPGITYADKTDHDSKEEEFARKVIGDFNSGICEDFQLTPADLNMNAGGSIEPAGASANAGTAANRQVSGYSYGIGLGGAGGGGFSRWFVLGCRGGGCNGTARNISYVRYRRVPGIEGGM